MDKIDQESWLLEAFLELGVDIPALNTFLTVEQSEMMQMSPEKISVDDLNSILLICEELTGRYHFGLDLITQIDVAAYGTYGYLLLNASTVAEFLELASRYYPIFYHHGTISTEIGNGICRVTYKRHIKSKVSTRHDDEWTLGFFAHFLHTRLGDLWHPIKASFTHHEPKDTRQLKKLFGRNILFDALITSFEFDAGWLEARINETDARLLCVIREHADILLNQYSATRQLEDRVKMLVMQTLYSESGGIPVVAKELGMSVSTLKRKLAAHGTDFSALRDDTLKSVAIKTLTETNLPIATIAMNLGFSEHAAFIRFFKRLCHVTPRDYRRKASSRTKCT